MNINTATKAYLYEFSGILPFYSAIPSSPLKSRRHNYKFGGLIYLSFLSSYFLSEIIYYTLSFSQTKSSLINIQSLSRILIRYYTAAMQNIIC
ncbi:MAG: hypothetical protein E7487_05865 [Ruminococcaceae bacterium]|nr:hypothetical protein [Oscillospiraceae bacterium]